MQVKRNYKDRRVLRELSSVDGNLTGTDVGVLTITCGFFDLIKGEYYYDVQGIHSGTNVHTVLEGRFIIDYDTTRV